MKVIRSSVGKGLRAARLSRNLSQEEFDSVSGRTYVSELERGQKMPTVVKIDQLAALMQLHPLTVLALSYCKTPSAREAATVMSRVSSELHDVFVALTEREKLLLEAKKQRRS